MNVSFDTHCRWVREFLSENVYIKGFGGTMGFDRLYVIYAFRSE